MPVVRRSADSAFLMTRDQYLAHVASLRRYGCDYLAQQFMNLFKMRTDYVESPPIAPDDPSERLTSDSK
jgi:hypothetical protein